MISFVGYCLSIRSERRLSEEVHFNLAYSWFCRLYLDGDVPDPTALMASMDADASAYLRHAQRGPKASAPVPPLAELTDERPMPSPSGCGPTMRRDRGGASPRFTIYFFIYPSEPQRRYHDLSKMITTRLAAATTCRITNIDWIFVHDFICLIRSIEASANNRL